MCAGCRSGRQGFFAFTFHWGSLKSDPSYELNPLNLDYKRFQWVTGVPTFSPLARLGEGNPRPWLWLRIWRFDICFTPFDVWRLRSNECGWGRFNQLGPFELSYLRTV